MNNLAKLELFNEKNFKLLQNRLLVLRDEFNYTMLPKDVIFILNSFGDHAYLVSK